MKRKTRIQAGEILFSQDHNMAPSTSDKILSQDMTKDPNGVAIINPEPHKALLENNQEDVLSAGLPFSLYHYLMMGGFLLIVILVVYLVWRKKKSAKFSVNY